MGPRQTAWGRRRAVQARDALGHQQRRWMFPFQHLLLSPAVKWSLAEDGGGSTATTGDRLRLAAPCVSPSPRAPGGRRERPRCPWRGWTYRELVRTLRGATSAAQMSRPNHPLPESPATRAGRFAFFFIVIRKNGSGRFFLRKSIIKEIHLEVKKKKVSYQGSHHGSMHFQK